MNVRVIHKLYIKTISENFFNVEWLTITPLKVIFRVNCVTHLIPVKNIIDFKVTQ